ncbi:Transporter, major facilitator family protein [Aphelenchoides bicaudatus]|nr:Transporter, major facilitator family protein [Aphelenchoides bicaudatus]
MRLVIFWTLCSEFITTMNVQDDPQDNPKLELASNCSSCEHEPKEVPKTPWRSIILIGCFMLCTGAQFGLFFASIWPYMQILDHKTTESFLGYCIASYSFGQIIAAPLVGYISNRVFKSIRLPVVACILIQMAGNVIYVSAQLFESDRRWVIFVARFVNGIGATNIGLLKNFLCISEYVAGPESCNCYRLEKFVDGVFSQTGLMN